MIEAVIRNLLLADANVMLQLNNKPESIDLAVISQTVQQPYIVINSESSVASQAGGTLCNKDQPLAYVAVLNVHIWSDNAARVCIISDIVKQSLLSVVKSTHTVVLGGVPKTIVLQSVSISGYGGWVYEKDMNLFCRPVEFVVRYAE